MGIDSTMNIIDYGRVVKIVVDINVGRCYVYKNNVLYGNNKFLENMVRILYGIFTRSHVSMKDSADNDRTVYFDQDFAGQGVDLYECSDTSELPFNSNKCSSVGSVYSDVIASYIETVPTIEAVFSANKDASSVSLAFRLYYWYYVYPNPSPTRGGPADFCVTHFVKSVNVGDTIRYKIKFSSPWLFNFAKLIAAIMCGCNDFKAVDTNGNEYNIRGNGVILASNATLVIGSGTAQYSPMDNRLDNMVEVPTQIRYAVKTGYGLISIVGMFKPQEDYQLGEIGLTQSIYDVDGNSHSTLLMRYVLSSPVILTKDKLYVFNIRLMFGD